MLGSISDGVCIPCYIFFPMELMTYNFGAIIFRAQTPVTSSVTLILSPSDLEEML